MMGAAAPDLQEGDLPNELWVVYKKEREEREQIKEWIAGTINFAKNQIPYCHLSKNILDFQPSKGISSAQVVYISTMAMMLDPNRDRATAIVEAFMKYAPGCYDKTLHFLLNKGGVVVEEEDRVQELAELMNGLKMDVAEQRANIDQLYSEVFKEEEEEACHCEMDAIRMEIEQIKVKANRLDDDIRANRLKQKSDSDLSWKDREEIKEIWRVIHRMREMIGPVGI